MFAVIIIVSMLIGCHRHVRFTLSSRAISFSRPKIQWTSGYYGIWIHIRCIATKPICGFSRCGWIQARSAYMQSWHRQIQWFAFHRNKIHVLIFRCNWIVLCVLLASANSVCDAHATLLRISGLINNKWKWICDQESKQRRNGKRKEMKRRKKRAPYIGSNWMEK